MTNPLVPLQEKLKHFISERDWEQFHSPKNLAIGLSVEASELLEIFTWLTQDESKQLDDQATEKVKDEVGDILIYLIDLCNNLNLDPIECANQKLEKNAAKYPVAKARGNATKYSDLE